MLNFVIPGVPASRVLLAGMGNGREASLFISPRPKLMWGTTMEWAKISTRPSIFPRLGSLWGRSSASSASPTNFSPQSSILMNTLRAFTAVSLHHNPPGFPGEFADSVSTSLKEIKSVLSANYSSRALPKNNLAASRPFPCWKYFLPSLYSFLQYCSDYYVSDIFLQTLVQSNADTFQATCKDDW